MSVEQAYNWRTAGGREATDLDEGLSHKLNEAEKTQHATTAPSIAVVILTYNEEVNLSACLTAVKWADEILVVDSGSQDQTVAIAQAEGIRTLTRRATPFLISQQRNFALETGELTADWILFVDADEIVTEALRCELQETLATAPTEIIAYRLAPKFMFLGKWLRHCGGYPVWHDRLLRNGQLRFTGGVWESFDLTAQIDAAIGYIEEPYLHNSVNKGIDDWLTKHSRYATAEALDILTTLGEKTADIQPIHRTTRKRGLRTVAAYLWPLRPILRFFVMYVWQWGFLDGLPGFLYSLMITCYEFLIVLKVLELRRRRQGLPI